MAGAILREHVPGLKVTTSGTHVIEGMPMSWRTWTRSPASASRFRTIAAARRRRTNSTLADLVTRPRREHVLWMRRTHPTAAPRIATLKRLVRDLPKVRAAVGTAGRDALARGAARRTRTYRIRPEAMQPVFVECAQEIAGLLHALIPRPS